jgi:hypothetical protein
MAALMAIKTGYYRHYKGPMYQVLALVRHSETDEELVLYRALYGDFGLWVRPLEMFISNVEVAGELVPRFSFVSQQPPAELADLLVPPLHFDQSDPRQI